MSVINNSFSLPNITGSDLSDSKKIKAILDSLRMLDENLRYSVYNLDPDENFSEQALKTYKGIQSEVIKLGKDGAEYRTAIRQNAESIRLEAERALDAENALKSRLSLTAEGLIAEVERAKGAEGELSSSLSLTAQGLTSEVTRAKNAEKTLSSSITQTAEQIELKVSRAEIIAEINDSKEEDAEGKVTINADKINLNGAVTANEHFKINEDGSVETNAITIGGADSRINIQTSANTYDVIALNYLDGTNTLLTGLKPGEIRTEFNTGVASMDGVDGFAFWDAASGIDAKYGKDCITNGYGEFGYGIYIGASAGIASRYNNQVIVQDYGNGNVSINSVGKTLYLGYKNTTGVTVRTDFDVEGTKNRIVPTSKGMVRLGAYETTEPYFGDLGSGIIGPDGMVKVPIDPLFLETVSIANYKVFLQGDVKLSKKNADGFVVTGEPGACFDWEIKARQKGYETRRLERIGG